MLNAEPCPECGNRRRNVDDVQNGYCPRCHWWTFDEVLTAGWRRQWPEKAAEALEFKLRNL